MAALAIRSSAGGWEALGILRRSFFAPFRSLSSATAATPADVSEPEKKKRQKKNLFDVAKFLPNWGLGYKIAKNNWRDVSYELTKINLYKGGRHGKAWGFRYKAGKRADDDPVKISGVNKRGWKYLPIEKNKAQCMPAAEAKSVA